MSYTTRNYRNHLIITLEGSLDIYSAPTLKKDFHKLIDSGALSIVFDMKNIKLLDSSGIALLANLQKKLQSLDGRFFLMNLNSDILVILKLASLESFFKIVQAESELT
ncbi:MAG: STAS domain-containing protein [Leptospira sp.]|nr:STAS domain-containing protein [Leptospira sp.]